MGKIYLISDCHFNHSNIIKYGRPFSSIEEMNETIVSNWNDTVGEEDIVYVLGDFFMGKSDGIEPILSRLRGHIKLIRGNHDTDARLKKYQELGVEYLGTNSFITYKGKIFILNHFPLVDKAFYDAIINRDRTDIVFCYGHVHEKPIHWEENPYALFHVGVDTNDFTPVPLEKIWKYSEKPIDNQ